MPSDSTKALVEARTRLERFAGSEPFTGQSGFDVYPGGIFQVDGPNTFFADLRLLLSPPQPTGEDAELVAEAEALHLRSTIHQHAKMLDDALQAQRNLPDVQVRKFAVQVVLALLDEHELMVRRLATALSARSIELEAARAVIEPFSKAFVELEPEYPGATDDCDIYAVWDLTLGDFRHARAFLSKEA